MFQYFIDKNIFDFRYASALFTCQTDDPQDLSLISLTANPCNVSKNALRVTSQNLQKVNITACVAPLTRSYQLQFQLVETMEINSMFGIQRFVFYNTSLSDRMRRYIRYYMDKNVGYIFPWNLEGITDKHSWDMIYYGQIAAQMDCFYRHLNSSNYIAYLDLDELLVPRSDNMLDLMSLIHEALKTTRSTICNYQFRHVNFNMAGNESVNVNATNDDLNAIKTWHINSLRAFKRSDFWRHRERSKYIADTDHLVVPGVHLPEACRNNTVSMHLPTSEAAVYHYRKTPLWRPITETDTTLWRFKDSIIARITTVHKEIMRPMIATNFSGNI